MTPTLHYIFDPLCGRCYAAAPMLRTLTTGLGDTLQLALQPGLLMPEPRPIAAAFREHIVSADQRIAELAGVPFGQAYLDRVRDTPQLVYHSVPPAAAVMAAAALRPDGGLHMLEAVQRAHYVLGQDVRDPVLLNQIAQSIGVTAGDFDAAFADAVRALPAQAEAARALMQAAGGGGFPCFVLAANGRQTRIDHGSFYRDPALMLQKLTALLAH